MSDENNKERDILPNSEENNQPSAIRMEVLQQIESGDIAVDEGLKRLQILDKSEQAGDVLSQLEHGEIDVQEAIHRIEDQDHSTNDDMDFQPTDSKKRAGQLRSWWIILFASGLGGTAFGGWLASIGGWWWLLAVPSLTVGLFVLLLALLTYRSPWIHLHVNTGRSTWPSEFFFGFPVPTRLAAWAIRKWGPQFDSLEHTAIDELLTAMDGHISGDNPILVEVNEDAKSGEKIQITIG